MTDFTDISVPLHFNGAQPNAYGVKAATANACEYGALVGDTRRGGSCNFERITFIPHCNGTHTECVGHITNERISVRDCLVDVMMPAQVVSVEPEMSGDDLVISTKSLKKVQPLVGAGGTDSLIIRTLPNDDTKLSRVYDENNIPPYFTTEAMQFIVECGFKHLLVDMPSIDRLFDDGLRSCEVRIAHTEDDHVLAAITCGNRRVVGAPGVGAVTCDAID